MMSITDIVKSICSFYDRRAGRSGEADAAEWLAGVFRELGLAVNTERFSCPPSYSFVLLVHFAFGLAAAAVVRLEPLVGFILASVAAVSLLGEMSLRFFWLRRLVEFSVSRNVIGVRKIEKPDKKVVFMAQLDAPLAVENRELLHNFLLPSSRLPLLLLSGLSIVYLIRYFGGGGWRLLIIEAVLLLGVLVLAALAAQQHWRSLPSPGANNGASGLALLAELARYFSTNAPPAGVECWFLAAGAGFVNHDGARRFLESTFYRFDHYSAFFINLPAVGGGNLSYLTSEQVLLPVFYPPDLVYLTSHTAREENFTELEPVALKAHTDAVVPAREGYKTITIISLGHDGVPFHFRSLDDQPGNISENNCQRAFDFVLKLLERIAKE